MATRKRKIREEFPSVSASDGVRERILEAAQGEFRRHGSSRVSMDALAAGLGMSKKTIYKHFPSKDALLRAFVHLNMHRIENGISAVVRSDKSSLEKVTSLLGIVGNQVIHFSKEMQADLARHEPSLWKEIEAFRRRVVINNILPVLRQAKQEGMIHADLKPELFFLVLLNSIEGILNPFTLADQPFSTEEAFTGIFHILFRGALTPEASERFRTTFIPPTLNG
jgi:AcrR family transcriptional regulator